MENKSENEVTEVATRAYKDAFVIANNLGVPASKCDTAGLVAIGQIVANAKSGIIAK